MSKITGVIISKNSEDLISDCIKSISFCDEIILIDSNSSDKTAEIAKSLGARVFELSGMDFSQMRNLGFEKATGDWVLYIDTDERISPELAQNIKKSLNKESIAAFKIRRKNFYFGENEWPYIEKIERLFKKDKLKGWYGKIHESPNVEGKVETLDGFLLHYTHRDLSSMVKKTLEWSKIEAELRYKSNHPKMSWWRFPRVMTTAFLDSYVRQRGYKAGIVGLLESTYQSFSIFVTYARLWEMQNKNEKP